MKTVVNVMGNSYSMENTPSVTSKSMFYYIQAVGHFFCGADYCTERKDYNSMLILYTVNGTGYLRYNNREYTLKSGDVFIIDCMEYQYYATDPDDLWNILWLHFNGCESRAYVKRIIDNGGPVFKLKDDSIIPKHIEKIICMLKERDRRVDIIGSCMIVEMLTELLLLGSNGFEKDEYMPFEVRKLLNKIENEYCNPINLDSLSKDIGISKFHLSRLFKKYTGYSPYDYLIKYRINQSKVLLKATELPVYEIAQKVGFDSVSNFIKIFRQHESVTPLKFRKYWR